MDETAQGEGEKKKSFGTNTSYKAIPIQRDAREQKQIDRPSFGAQGVSI